MRCGLLAVAAASRRCCPLRHALAILVDGTRVSSLVRLRPADKLTGRGSGGSRVDGRRRREGHEEGLERFEQQERRFEREDRLGNRLDPSVST